MRKQQNDEEWEKFVSIAVKKASKIDVILAAIELKIPTDQISFQSADPELVKEARNYIGDRAKHKSKDEKKRKKAEETLGAPPPRKRRLGSTPLVCSAKALEEFLKK